MRGDALGDEFVDTDFPLGRGDVRDLLNVFQSVFFKFIISSIIALISPRPGSVFDRGLLDRLPSPAKGGSLGLVTFGEKELDFGIDGLCSSSPSIPNNSTWGWYTRYNFGTDTSLSLTLSNL